MQAEAMSDAFAAVLDEVKTFVMDEWVFPLETPWRLGQPRIKNK